MSQMFRSELTHLVKEREEELLATLTRQHLSGVVSDEFLRTTCASLVEIRFLLSRLSDRVRGEEEKAKDL